MTSSKTAEDWLAVLMEVTEEFAHESLGFTSYSTERHHGAAPRSGTGTYIPLVGARASLEMGIVSTDDGCRQLAGALLGMDADESAEMSEDDVVDAFCEIINIVSGVVKQRVNEEDSSFNLGLPIFVKGQIRVMEHQGTAVADVQAGGIPVQLVVVTPQR
jgi:CheY-specific phosphatase CheX